MESADENETPEPDNTGTALDAEPDAVGEAAAADAGESAPAAGGQDGLSAGTRWLGRSLRWWAAAAVLVGTLTGAGYEGWLLFAHQQRSVAAAQALDAAEKYTLTLTGVDPSSIDKNFADVLDGATGEFKDQYTKSSETLRQLLIENNASAHGTVIDAAVKSATRNRVEVLLFVDQSVSNKAAPGPQFDRSRIALTMEKVNGRWLASSVDLR